MPSMREDTASARASRANFAWFSADPHALYQVQCVLERKLLRLMVVREFWQVVGNKLDATAIQERPSAFTVTSTAQPLWSDTPMTASRILIRFGPRHCADNDDMS